MSRFDGLAAFVAMGQSSKPSQGRFGFRNARGEIVEVDAPRVAQVVDPKEMFKWSPPSST